MNTPSSTIVQRLWNYCNVLRDDGMSYGDYVEQLTYLLFLRMDQEGSAMLGLPSSIPEQFNWASLQRLDGDDLERHYRAILAGLGQGAGLIPSSSSSPNLEACPNSYRDILTRCLPS